MEVVLCIMNLVIARSFCLSELHESQAEDSKVDIDKGRARSADQSRSDTRAENSGKVRPESPVCTYRHVRNNFLSRTCGAISSMTR